MYGLKDVQALCHAHIACGAPNTWRGKRHCGRKRCGMLFAMTGVRAQPGLKAKPVSDPDVKAKHLIDDDQELSSILYGATPAQTVRRPDLPPRWATRLVSTTRGPATRTGWQGRNTLEWHWNPSESDSHLRKSPKKGRIPTNFSPGVCPVNEQGVREHGQDA